jgi:YD repeat-containing protein
MAAASARNAGRSRSAGNVVRNQVDNAAQRYALRCWQPSRRVATRRIAAPTAHDGTVTFTAYDSKGRETESATFAASFSTATARPALANASKVVSTKWHATFALPTQVAEPNKLTTNTYNAKGMLTGQSWTATTDATGAAKFNALKTGSTYATGWGYNANSLATSIVTRETAAGATAAVETGRWTLAYKTNGDLTKSTNVLTGTSYTVTQTSAHGKATAAIDDSGQQLAFQYDARGQSFKRTEPARTYTYNRAADGEVSRVDFDASNALTFERDLNGTLRDVKLNGRSIVGTQLLAGASSQSLRDQWLARLFEPAKGPMQRLLDLFIAPAHAQEVLLPACTLGPNPVCITGVTLTVCKVVIVAGAAAIVAVNRKRSCGGGACGDRDSPECKAEREHCTEICNRARYDPDMPNVWGGSFRNCFNGCVSSRCK